jgi:hypothetical protein
MAEPIVASYVQEKHDWTVTVSGYGKELTGGAPGIIAARDRADEFVTELGPDAQRATVVHLLNGSALEFTAAYMTARLTRPAAPPDVKDDQDSAEEEPQQPAEERVEEPVEESRSSVERKPQSKSARRPRAKLTADIGDALTAARPKPNPEPASVNADSRVAETAAQGS